MMLLTPFLPLLRPNLTGYSYIGGFCKDLSCSPRFLAKTARLGQTDIPALRKASAAHVLQLNAEKYLGTAL